MKHRDVKFRVWDRREHKGESTKSMLYNAQEHPLWNLFVEMKDYDYIIMEYTGVEDLNRREIYEGDRVIIHTGEKESDISTVIFERGTFKLDGLEIGRFTSSELEVCGNIYEN